MEAIGDAICSDGDACNLSKLPPEMLEKCLWFCTINDLKSCRLVNKYWRNTVLNLWQGQTWVRMDYVHGITGRLTKSISGYLELLDGDKNQEIETQCQFVNFSLNLSISDEEVPMFELFLEKCGDQVKALKLEYCVFPSLSIFRKTIFRDCPNLEYLQITGSRTRVRAVKPKATIQKADVFKDRVKFTKNENLKYFKFRECTMYQGYVTLKWADIFEHFPKIKTLNMKCSAESMGEIFAAVKNEHANCPKNLKLEQIFTANNSYIQAAVAEVLTDSTIHLRDLSLTVAQDDGEKLQKILSVHGSTLKTLKLRGNGLVNFQDCFPALSHGLFQNLTKLHALGRMFRHISYLEHMPNLQKLILLKGYNNESIMFSDATNIRLSFCTEFETDYDINPDMLEKLTNFIPNLRSLQMPLRNPTFELVCRKWQKLVSITIIDSRVDESGLTGLDADLVSCINQNKLTSTLAYSSVPKANLAGFNDLRSFFMQAHYRFNGPMAYLSYASAFFAFRKTPSLVQISIQNYQVNHQLWEIMPDEGSSNIYTLRSDI